MDHSGQERAIQSLRDWCKWLIGLDFGVGAGCVAIFVQSPSSVAVTPFLVAAIAFFVISLGCSVLLLRELAYLTEHLPFLDENGELTTIFGEPGEAGFSIGALATSQLLLSATAVALFFAWVISKALTG
jgi:hypothetical protein